MPACRQFLFFNFWLIFLLFHFCYLPNLGASVKQVDSLEAIKNDLLTLDSESLLVLDVDEVLLTDEDAILSPSGDTLRAQIYNEYYHEAKSEYERQKITEILMLPLFSNSKKLVENSWPTVIKKLQEANVKVIALTSCPIETQDQTRNMEIFRIHQLAQKNISFEGSFPHLKRMVLPLSEMPKKTLPVYSAGILFTGAFSKADVLNAFLKEVDFSPKTLVFVDNLLSNVQRMEMKMLECRRAHQGYHYQFVEKKGQLTVDSQIARKQFEHLFQYREWLHDDEIKARYFLEN